jgi:hypothetical protein
MVRTDTKTETIKNLYQRNTDKDWNKTGQGISIESSFQRGDEENGIWTNEFKRVYIDSLQCGFPAGILTFVKDNKCATSYQDPWKVLDGGNRTRAIRDYIDDVYQDENGFKFSELSEKDRAEFNTILIPCQEITIERNDPPDTITKMFIRLNTKINPLRQGELIKSHGHGGDVWIIEMAKKLIAGWTSTFQDVVKVAGTIDLNHIQTLWASSFGELKETNRCDTLAMITGFIVSAKTSNFTLFDKRYYKLSNTLSKCGTNPTPDDLDLIYKKLLTMLDIISNISDKSIFGKVCKGVPPQTKIAPLWKKICEGDLNEADKNKFIWFYNAVNDNIDLRNKYLELFKDTNSETGNLKIQRIVDFILQCDIV